MKWEILVSDYNTESLMEYVTKIFMFVYVPIHFLGGELEKIYTYALAPTIFPNKFVSNIYTHTRISNNLLAGKLKNVAQG